MATFTVGQRVLVEGTVADTDDQEPSLRVAYRQNEYGQDLYVWVDSYDVHPLPGAPRDADDGLGALRLVVENHNTRLRNLEAALATPATTPPPEDRLFALFYTKDNVPLVYVADAARMDKWLSGQRVALWCAVAKMGEFTEVHYSKIPALLLRVAPPEDQRNVWRGTTSREAP